MPVIELLNTIILNRLIEQFNNYTLFDSTNLSHLPWEMQIIAQNLNSSSVIEFHLLLQIFTNARLQRASFKPMPFIVKYF